MIIEGDSDAAIETAADQAIGHAMAVVVLGEDGTRMIVVPDVLLLELHANNIPLAGLGRYLHSADGRSVLVFSPT